MTFVVVTDIVDMSERYGGLSGNVGFSILTPQGGDNIAKIESIGCIIKEAIQKGELRAVFEEFVEPAPGKRLALLWEIAMETDWNDLDLLEEKIYRYGSYLGAKDQLGRLLFVRMEYLLRNARNAKKMN